MLRSSSVFTRQGRRASLVAAAGAVPLALATPAFAQSACSEFQNHRQERQSLVQQFQKLVGKDKKVQPKDACAVLSKIVANGTTSIKWLESNKDWCQIPDQFLASFKTDHANAQKIRGQACDAAAKQAQMEKKAREAGGSGLLGGDGLEGSFKIPKGAL
jgi:hypothetical protein